MPENIGSTGMRVGASRDNNKDDQERKQRDVQRCFCHSRQGFAPAVEEVAEEVDELVCHYCMPGFGNTVVGVSTTDLERKTLPLREQTWDLEAYNDGWPSCHIPTTPDPRLRATLALAKMAPAYPNQPVR